LAGPSFKVSLKCLASICAAAKHPIFKVVWRATLRRRRNFGLPLVRDYQNDLQAIGSTDFTYMGLEGYLNGLVMITALRGSRTGADGKEANAGKSGFRFSRRFEFALAQTFGRVTIKSS
jgi:hypothetical protein